jgi:hypothetical protein
MPPKKINVSNRAGSGRKPMMQKIGEAKGQTKLSFIAGIQAQADAQERQAVVVDLLHNCNHQIEEECYRQQIWMQKLDEQRAVIWQQKEQDAVEALHCLATAADRDLNGRGGGDDDSDDDREIIESDDEDYNSEIEQDEEEEVEDQNLAWDVSSIRRRNRRKYKPPKGSFLAEYLDTIKQQILGPSESEDLAKGKCWFPPERDPSAGTPSHDPTDFYASQYWVYAFIPF